MKNIKPIYLMWQEGVCPQDIKAIFSGLKEVLFLANVVDLLPVSSFGVWRIEERLCEQSSLLEWNSIQWYIEMARKYSLECNRLVANPRSGRQLCADTLLTLCANEPWQKRSPHYDVTIVNDDMFSGRNNFVIGLASSGLGTILSVHRFQNLHETVRFECIKTETIHELGHVFGLLPKSRNENVEESLGRPFCDQCVAALRRFFL